MKSTKKPNIILINCDDLGYGDLSCYGSERHSTPALDQMADEGVRFTNFYMASSVCSPSRGAMMTGCYPKRIGFGSFEGKKVLFPGQGVGLNPNETTIAKSLQNEGYSTMLVGKWHCGDQAEFLPTQHGFEHYYGIPYSNDMGRQASKGHRAEFPPLPLMLDDQVLQEQPDQNALTERYAEQSVRFIRENKEKPFFLYLAHMHVHLPLYVSDRFHRQSRNGAYGAAVECIDWVTGVLLDELKRQGIDQNTIVIFTSDNGSRCDNEGSNGSLRGRKTTSWEGGFRVPCIMRWPDSIPAGRVCDEIATSMDFFPTLLNLAGAQLPADRMIDGKDIQPLMLHADAITPYKAFFYYNGNNLEAVRSNEWKLHIRRDEEKVKELYNLKIDLAETTNVYDQHSEIVKQLEKLLDECREDLGDDAADIAGKNCRTIGTVDSPKPLTQYDEEHPYIIAKYDLEDAG